MLNMNGLCCMERFDHCVNSIRCNIIWCKSSKMQNGCNEMFFNPTLRLYLRIHASVGWVQICIFRGKKGLMTVTMTK